MGLDAGDTRAPPHNPRGVVRAASVVVRRQRVEAAVLLRLLPLAMRLRLRLRLLRRRRRRRLGKSGVGHGGDGDELSVCSEGHPAPRLHKCLRTGDS